MFLLLKQGEKPNCVKWREALKYYVTNANFSKLTAILVMDIFLQLPLPRIIINENYTHQSFLKNDFLLRFLRKMYQQNSHYFSPNF